MPKRLRQLLKEAPDCLIGPGVFDGISAHVANSVGFDYLYLAGSGATGSFCGEPDLSVMTATEFAQLARMIVEVSDVPVIADADTGFGGPLNIARTIALYESAGVAGCHIEDQTFPKRCGQLDGKDVVDIDTYTERIAAAVRARRNPDFVILARTDARNAAQFGGPNAGEEAFEEGIKRLKAALDAGADVAFMESPRGKDECARLVKALEGRPVMINVLPDGLTGNLTVRDVKELGFRMCMFPCTGFIPAMLAMQRSYKMLKEEGSDLKACEGRTIKNFFEQVGLKAAFDFDNDVNQFIKNDIPGSKYENLSSHDLF
ncbi:carboxyphosphonoenolpyruvate mutase [Gloeophyllum trabeum ATCC 11539]|uniref:Carboxyphosphonoenolpyruvate mutase n=1 Tax=Gloeophyllum trabeum (strain ATCC 11539 / FP-39264 / Madison 617) TaxID=670483 RepID=S7Q148_GLOTA|nr:carboxyphosphonoenolpyruvate mutase [Gloeophyllum trabeum ATCC 11539]EPQ53671.1 carboxyphosphonoenolpyruvate mutase [Gloeophyllum trabeum ATCC 11539]